MILTRNLPNGTVLLNPEYNRNNDTFISLERELRPALEQNEKSFFAASKSELSEDKCTNLEGCSAYERSFLAFDLNLGIIAKVPPSTGILILNGENDTQTPVQQALLLQQRLTEVNRYPKEIQRTQGKKRMLILEGICGCYIAKQELILEPGDKWTPTTHIQKCPKCNKE